MTAASSPDERTQFDVAPYVRQERNRRRWMRRHPYLLRLGIALLAGGFTLLVLEAFGRWRYPERLPARGLTQFWRYDERLGWAHLPNQRAQFEHFDFNVHVAINSLGMRDTEYPVERTARHRMLVIGDSFGWGWGVEHAERFSEIIEAEHSDWEIINACVSGYGTTQEYIYLRDDGLKFKPDVVLLLFTVNDFGNNVRGDEHWHFKPYFSIENGERFLHNVPVPRETLRQRLSRFWQSGTFIGQEVARFQQGVFVDNNSAVHSAAAEVTDYLLSEIQLLCDKNDVQFVLVSDRFGDSWGSKLATIATRHGIRHLSLGHAFEACELPVRFPHDPHWNRNGHEVAAEAVNSFLSTTFEHP